MLFKKKYIKKKLNKYKTVRIEGFKFVIRKLNPLLDFEIDQMPQIFSDYIMTRQPAKTEVGLQRAYNDMKMIVEKGIVEPEIVPVGKGDKRGTEEGVTIEDVFRDEAIGIKLYIEIIAHSLNQFRGLRGLFFYQKIRRLLYTEWQKNMAKVQQA